MISCFTKNLDHKFLVFNVLTKVFDYCLHNTRVKIAYFGEFLDECVIDINQLISYKKEDDFLVMKNIFEDNKNITFSIIKDANHLNFF